MTTDAAISMRSRGMRDLLPDDMERVRRIEGAFAGACRDWGYREIRTPVIEPLHLFTSAGTLSPKMLDSVYSFLDWDGWSGERVVLRPDSTIPAARLYAERLGDRTGVGVAKLYYSQSIFHFADSEASREEWQCGVELIGDTGVAGDVELVLLALATLSPLDLPPLSVRVSHAGLVRAVLAAAGLSADEQSAAYDRLLDGDTAVVEEIEARLPQLNAPLRLLFEVEGAGSGYIANLRAALTQAIPSLAPALDDLAFVVEALEAAGVATIIQAALARSFEYYSGLVFKIYADGERICSGGRYDDLIALVGGRDVPASGFAHYISPIAALMPAVSPTVDAASVLVTAADRNAAATAAVHAFASQLRAAGITAATTAASASAVRTRVVCSSDGTYALIAEGQERRFAAVPALIDALRQRS